MSIMSALTTNYKHMNHALLITFNGVALGVLLGNFASATYDNQAIAASLVKTHFQTVQLNQGIMSSERLEAILQNQNQLEIETQLEI